MPMIRVTNQAHSMLKELARLSNASSLQAILADAIELYRREKFLQQFNQGYENIKDNIPAWNDELKERSLLENTLTDDLDDNESW